jgi:predicted unusual protein kinase regulating ubiquinone biosynthesis (AarF/ABC1/UbiB family)
MIRPFPSAVPDDAREARRREVERLLAAADLQPPAGGAAWPQPGLGERLATALSAAGPAFALFGRYLATRADVLPAELTLDLSRIPDRAPALAADEVLACLRRELAADPWVELRTLDLTPLASRLLTQEHRAVTAAGQPVVLVLLRPGVVERLQQDAPLLPLLDPLLEALAPARRSSELRAGFGRVLAEVPDLTIHQSFLSALAAEEPELLAVPGVDPRLSTPRLLVRQDLGGRRLDRLAAAPPDAAAPILPRPGAETQAVMRRVCRVWLRQAFLGGVAPAEPRAEDVEVLADGRLAFVGGTPLSSPPAVREHFWEHLAATAALDPTAAGDALLREVERTPGAVDESELILRLRQVVPFRDGAWSVAAESLAEHLFAGWRLAGECGYRLRAPALDLSRGIAALAALARRTVPEDDPLLAAFEDLRLARGLGRLRQAADPRALAQEALPYAQLLLALPQKLDSLLTMVARGDVRLRLEADEPRAPADGGRGVVLLAVAAAALAIGLVVGRLAGPDGIALEEVAGSWGGLLVLAAGALLLRWVSRGG